MVPKGTVDSQTQQPPDVEDVCITTNTANTMGVHQIQDVQAARKKLAAKKRDVDMVINVIIQN